MLRLRFVRFWLLWSGLYTVLAALGPNGLLPAFVWPDVSQHLLQARAWLGRDIRVEDELGRTLDVVEVVPRLDVTPYFEHRVERDPRERGLVSNLAVAVRQPDGSLAPAQEAWTGSTEHFLTQDLVCHVGFPPGPAYLLLPMVALLGGAVAVQWVGAVLGGLAVALMDRLFRQWFDLIGRDSPALEMLSVLAGAGTLWLWLVPLSGTFLFAQTVGTTALVAALTLAGAGRRWSAGLCLGLAVTSRPAMIGALPLVLIFALAARGGESALTWAAVRRHVPRLIPVAVGPLVLGAVTLVLNQLRFGSPSELGYRFMIVPPFLRERVLEHGQLSVAHLWRNLRFSFLELPMLVRDAAGDLVFPWLISDPRGMGLLWVTPACIAVVLALPRGSGRRQAVALTAAWLSLVLTCLPGMLYYNTGWVQWGGRFLVDAWPIWLLLAATGLRRLPAKAGVILVALSVAACAWGAALTVARVWPACSSPTSPSTASAMSR